MYYVHNLFNIRYRGWYMHVKCNKGISMVSPNSVSMRRNAQGILFISCPISTFIFSLQFCSRHKYLLMSYPKLISSRSNNKTALICSTQL